MKYPLPGHGMGCFVSINCTCKSSSMNCGLKSSIFCIIYLHSIRIWTQRVNIIFIWILDIFEYWSKFAGFLRWSGQIPMLGGISYVTKRTSCPYREGCYVTCELYLQILIYELYCQILNIFVYLFIHIYRNIWTRCININFKKYFICHETPPCKGIVRWHMNKVC